MKRLYIPPHWENMDEKVVHSSSLGELGERVVYSSSLGEHG